MSNNNNGAIVVPPPPPFTSVDVVQNILPQSTSPPSTTDNDLSPSLVITVLVLATAVIVSASVYLLLKFVRRSRTPSSLIQRTTTTSSSTSTTTTTTAPSHRNNHHHHNGRIVPEEQNTSITDSLPLFTYASLSSGNSTTTAADCAVCLSKFEPEDRLRLLPACCHAFHADCIDAWLVTNQTCPLCRSSIFVSETDLLNKTSLTTSAAAAAAGSGGRNSSARRSGSFRVEIGSVSRRRLPSDFSGRSYSIGGSFEYVVDDDDIEVPEVAVVDTRRRLSEGDGYRHHVVEVDKQNQQQQDEEEVGVGDDRLAAEVGGGRGVSSSSWLKDYVDRLAWAAASCSLSSSLRSSGRFFGGGGGSMSGSSRRTEVSRGGVMIHDSDLEASRLGDEIGEMFRWLSGV